MISRSNALGISDALAQLTFSIALFGMAFSTLFYGSLSDRYGRRPVLLSGLCLFLVGSVISALADGVSTLALGRFVQAVGAGCGMTWCGRLPAMPMVRKAWSRRSPT